MIEIHAKTPVGVSPVPLSELEAGDAYVLCTGIASGLFPRYAEIYIRVLTGDENTPYGSFNLARPGSPMVRTSLKHSENTMVLPVSIGVYITDMGIRPSDEGQEEEDGNA